ncbi:uncharacterized protein LOC126897295 [Daktulosphaira vitifoliae]|uniref:uncharacterized protein LOC126897295 n=1 Tax=Daktulosphaira vitifoliae TaxID=58002 RepID=UPI0021A9AAE8|nr:uncharacterized protein LOC126897295 [Daktulosphaira vitifoliae]XP_050526768.1 uncharacterized protein LOC126897295 [Daktulosphaira vitifoliae]
MKSKLISITILVFFFALSKGIFRSRKEKVDLITPLLHADTSKEIENNKNVCCICHNLFNEKVVKVKCCSSIYCNECYDNIMNIYNINKKCSKCDKNVDGMFCYIQIFVNIKKSFFYQTF